MTVRSTGFHLPFVFGVIATQLVLTSAIHAGPRERAKKMHDRLTGVPPTQSTLEKMADLIGQGREEEAARIAIESPYFYNLSLKSWFNAWTNIDENPDVPLNDFSATAIGIVRDDLPFDRILYDDIVYVGAGAGVPAYSNTDNAHYIQLEQNRADLKQVLQQEVQTSLTNRAEAAGVMSLRAFGEAFYSAGTNRRALRFTFMNFLCMDLEQVSDTTRPDYRIRQDVDRSPGGDSTVFRNRCAGCHAGMDALAGAFAYYNFEDGRTIYQAGQVQQKFLQNGNIFPDGYPTEDDGWINLWTEGQNKKIGWNGEASGRGAAEYGRMIAQTDAFPTCMATRVFKKVCLREPASDDDKAHVKKLANNFSASEHNMKDLFAQTAVICTSDNK